MALASKPMVLDEELGEEGSNRNKWYYYFSSKKEIQEKSPSLLLDGINWDKETELRKSYCSFLRQLGDEIKVSDQSLIATAIVLCHRFFVLKSHAKYNCFKIATSCFLIASMKLKSHQFPTNKVIDASTHIIATKFNGGSGVVDADDDDIFDDYNINYGSNYSKKVVFQVLDFDVKVKLPFEYIPEVLNGFDDQSVNVSERENLELVAEKFIEDALDYTTLCLQFRPRQMAAAAVFYAGKLLKIGLHSKSDEREWICWWHKFGVSLYEIDEIWQQMKDNLYHTRISVNAIILNKKKETADMKKEINYIPKAAAAVTDETKKEINIPKAAGAAAATTTTVKKESKFKRVISGKRKRPDTIRAFRREQKRFAAAAYL